MTERLELTTHPALWQDSRKWWLLEIDNTDILSKLTNVCAHTNADTNNDMKDAKCVCTETLCVCHQSPCECGYLSCVVKAADAFKRPLILSTHTHSYNMIANKAETTLLICMTCANTHKDKDARAQNAHTHADANMQDTNTNTDSSHLDQKRRLFMLGEKFSTISFEVDCPQLHAVSELFWRHQGQNDLQNSPLCIDTENILKCVQASPVELLRFLVEGWYLYHRVDIPADPGTQAHTHKQNWFWAPIGITEILEVIKLVCVKLRASQIAHRDIPMRTFFDAIKTACGEQGFTLQCGLPFDDVICFQILRFFCDVHPIGEARQYVGEMYDTITLLQRMNLYLTQLHSLEDKTAILGNVSICPIRMMRVIQCGVLYSKHTISVADFMNVCGHIYDQIRFVDEDFAEAIPADRIEEKFQIRNVNCRAGMHCIEMEEYPSQRSYGFPSLRLICDRAASPVSLCLIAGVAMLERSEVQSHAHTNLQHAQALPHLTYAPHWDFKWNWKERLASLLKFKKELFEEEIEVFLTPTMHSGCKPLKEIYIQHLVRVTKSEPHKYVNANISLD